MIHVIAIITAKPGQREDVLKLFRANMPAVLAEDGCIEYVPVTDVPGFGGAQAPLGEDTFMVVEKWASAEALRAHGAAPHMVAYGKASGPMVANRAIHVLKSGRLSQDHADPLAARVAARLITRRQTVAVAESSAGGLVASRLLRVPGASAYFLGGGVIYTAAARQALLRITAEDMAGLRPSTEAYARLLADRVRQSLGADWGVAETGATGPTGNRYGDAAGHACLAVAGPEARLRTLETASTDRAANMEAFATAALELLEEALG